MLMLVLFGGLLVGGAGRAPTGVKPVVDPEKVCWSRLDLVASKFGLSLKASVSRNRLSPGEARGELLEPEGKWVGIAPGGPTERLELSTSFLNRHSESILLFDPADGTTFQRKVVETGGRSRYKVIRFAEEGIVTRRRSPRNEAEEDLHPRRWSEARQETDPYPPGVHRVVEPSVLFYLVSGLDLEDRDLELEVPFYTHNEIHRARLRLEELQRLRVDFEVLSSRGKRRVEGPRTVRRITVRPIPMDGKKGKLEFIGLEGEVELFVDAEYRVPVLVRGRVELVGRVEVRLRGLRQP